MDYSPTLVGRKAYGLSEFSRLGLFNRPFVILYDATTKEEVIEKLKNSGFTNDQKIAIRFSKDNTMNLPFYLGKYTLEEIADIIQRERQDFIPFVHGLINTTFSAFLYFDGKTLFIEVRPGIGSFKKHMFNESPDIIKIDDSIHISRYLRNRHIENVNEETLEVMPFSFDLLLKFTKRIYSFKDKLSSILPIQSPLLCDINAESVDDINFMGIQKIDNFDTKGINNIFHEFYVVKTIDDLEKYRGGKDLFFDIPLSRKEANREYIINILKNFPKVYVKSLIMHLSVILREFGVNVEKGSLHEEYENKEFPL